MEQQGCCRYGRRVGRRHPDRPYKEAPETWKKFGDEERRILGQSVEGAVNGSSASNVDLFNPGTLISGVPDFRRLRHGDGWIGSYCSRNGQRESVRSRHFFISERRHHRL